MSCAIQVAVQFEPRWLKLGFRTRWQAERYAERVRASWCHHNLRLETRVAGTWVLIRLPSAVIEIVSSASCCAPGYAGFYFRFSDPYVARRWEENLLCFRSVRGSRTDLFVLRDITEKEIFG
jgi:hypothetical protein